MALSGLLTWWRLLMRPITSNLPPSLLAYPLLFSLLVLGITLPGNARAESLYVIDSLIINLRAGQSAGHASIANLTSGARLELLESGQEYSRVRTSDGKEGWVLNQYLSKTPTAKQRLAELEPKLARFEAENTKLKAELAGITGRHGELDTTYQKVATEHKTLNEELERLRRVSAEPLKLEQENQTMKKDLLELRNDYELLRQEHQLMSDNSDREWFLTGAGVIVLGIIIGLIAPSLRGKKKSSW